MRIVLYIIWALFVATATYLLVKHLRQTKRHEQQIASWPKVQATVTGNVGGWTNGGGGGTRSRVFYPTYQFVHPNGALHAGESEVSYRNQQEPGSLLNVAYNPANPNQSFEVSSESKAVVGCLIPVFALFALLLFWFAGAFPLG
ncbi:DUF3592 domain-containing protein [Arthrobacter sp. ISL-95]|uniref:DUF3592 domain-containing protein n=1 Tax=Arthrobacter sp. ISL-95 TaxID=2819116 RepID=UPI001BE95BC5|nr:DUF3592 domain-containing protein [Arthrobacter sp. ISL-95]MBT2588272.1 DUF3592 domain-containing protein [Arthrobacter sp. ISL-95]